MERDDVDRLVRALNSLTLAVLSARREIAAGPIDPAHQRFVAEEESWAQAMERQARELLECGRTAA